MRPSRSKSAYPCWVVETVGGFFSIFCDLQAKKGVVKMEGSSVWWKMRYRGGGSVKKTGLPFVSFFFFDGVGEFCYFGLCPLPSDLG